MGEIKPSNLVVPSVEPFCFNTQFVLQDPVDGFLGELVHTVVETNQHIIAIGFDGYGQAGAAEGYGRPVVIEQYAGELRVMIWADINQEDPTHIINLEGAKESNRKHECD